MNPTLGNIYSNQNSIDKYENNSINSDINSAIIRRNQYLKEDINGAQNSINKYEKNAMNSARSANQLEKEVQKLNETFNSAKNNTNRYSSINGTRKVVNSRSFFERMFRPQTKLYRNSASSRNAAIAKKTRNNNYTRALKNRPLRNEKNTRKRANATMANLSLKKFNTAINYKERLKKAQILMKEESNKRWHNMRMDRQKWRDRWSTSVPVASTSQPSISYGPNHQPFTGLNFEPATAELEQHQLHINNLARNTRALQERINQRSKARHAKREQAVAPEFTTM